MPLPGCRNAQASGRKEKRPETVLESQQTCEREAVNTGTPRGRTLVELSLACGINVPVKDETDERPNLDFHSLRHTLASAMIKATKGDAEKVRRWMGHADSKVLLERYSHEFESVRGDRQIEQDIAEMDAAFGG